MGSRGRVRAGVLAALTSAVLAAPAAASTYTVNSTADSTDAVPGNNICLDGQARCTLRAAVGEAAAGTAADTIVLPAGTYTLTGAANENNNVSGDLDLAGGGPLAITGAGTGVSVISGGGTDRVLDVSIFGGFGNLSVSGVTIRTGNSGAAQDGGGIRNTGELALTDVVVTGNQAGAGRTGGGIYSSALLNLDRVTVQGNTAGAEGGGIKNTGSTPGLSATRVTISGNSSSTGTGGGLDNTGDAALVDSVVQGNTAAGDGGGINNNGFGPGLSGTRVTISGNSSSAGNGGGLSNFGDVALVDSVVRDNTVAGPRLGGGVYHVGFVMALTRAAVTGNSSGNGGQGGGVFNNGSGSTATNVTVSGNSVGPGGLGAGVFSDDQMALRNVTISANTGASGLRATPTFPSSASNSIIAGNPAGDCSGGAGAVTSGGGNVTGDGTCGFAGAGDRVGDARLRPLADNGGFVATRALMPDSPAIDAGTAPGCPAQDARLVTRPQLAACDSGAYEYSPPTSNVASSGCSRDGVLAATLAAAAGGAAPVALRYAVDGGASQRLDAPSGAATLQLTDGAHALEYWGESVGGDEELAHRAGTALVDGTVPELSITGPQRLLVGQRATAIVSARDATSGLAEDPSGERPIETATPGTRTLQASAGDRCGNATSASFSAVVGTVPVVARTFNVQPISGTVLVKLPGARRFVLLTEARQIPVGSIVDARRGRVRITIANGRGGFDTAEFYEGMFRLLQPRPKRGARAFANLVLAGGSFKACPQPRARAAARRSRKVRRLWGDGGGAFRTQGRYAAATLRGTVWLTQDRCDGTLVRVTQGAVTVRDFGRRRSVVVRAGRSYLARAFRR